jgi:hypothetical protein
MEAWVNRLGRRSARQVAHGLGVVTQRGRMLPVFLIAGAQRSGTSSLHHSLSQHPNVLGAVLQKGVHYFDLHYDRGLPWYRSNFPLRLTAERVRRRTGGPAVTFESSPYYLFHPLAGQRIARDLPGVRVISLVRDPVERAFSAHAHELARGFETEPFERALELEAGRTRGERERMIADPTYNSRALQHQSYLTRSQYVDQLQDLASHVGRERLLVVDSHRLFEDAGPAMKEIFDFLELPQPTGITFDQRNARARTPMPEGLRERLEEHFRPYDERLAEWLGWTPRWMG